jgi:ubiquinone/menaquinone biosynthesis C-methylase UbiE
MEKMSFFDPKVFDQMSADIWNEAAQHYDHLSRLLFRAVTDGFIEFSGIRPGEKVLDVACGPGAASLRAAAAVGPQGTVDAVDFAEKMLSIASARTRQAGSAPIVWRRMDAQRLEFPDGSFDAVICQLGLMLFALPKLALGEMARVAKAGGRVSCLVQGEADKMLFTSLLNKTMIKHVPELKIPGAPTIYDFGPPGILENALSQAGLARVESRRLSGKFRFESPEAYWETMASGAGRTGVLIQSLEPAKRQALKEDVLAKAAAYMTPTGFDIPYEFVMSRGVKAPTSGGEKATGAPFA